MRVAVVLTGSAALLVWCVGVCRLTLDFDTNKRIVDEVAKVPSKRIRNKISGFITHLIKRIARGPVRGISLKLQEEERERSLDFIPEHSALDVEKVDIDDDTQNMLRSLDFPNIPGTSVGAVQSWLFGVVTTPHHSSTR